MHISDSGVLEHGGTAFYKYFPFLVNDIAKKKNDILSQKLQSYVIYGSNFVGNQ